MLGELGDRGRTSRVPQEVRRAVLAYVEIARGEGLSWRRIAQGVDISEPTLRRWNEQQSSQSTVGLLPVEVIGEQRIEFDAQGSEQANSMSLISPGGYRVEGLGAEQLAALLLRVG